MGLDADRFASARGEVARRSGLTGRERRAALTALTDDWLAEVFARATSSVGGPFCLAAIGGYGRGELALGSDLDLLLLHGGGEAEAAAVADALWYPIWDSGVRLDHSVRTVGEARRVAASDIKAVLGLLDLRVVAGNAGLAADLRSAVLGDWRAMAGRRLPALQDLVRERKERFGEASQVLEPDLKESYGGLRDATILAGIAASWVTDVPHGDWTASVDFLLDVRDSLHRVTGRPSDRLVMQEQDAVAEELEGIEGADALLRAVYDSARAIAYASDITWHRVDRLTRGRQRTVRRPLRRPQPDRIPLADGIVLQEGEAVLALDADPGSDEGLVLRAAAAAAQAGVRLSPHTVDRLAREGRDPAVPWARSVRESFVSLLGAGVGLVPVWEALDQAGIIARLVPGWEVVRSAPQRNALHTYTVDRHLLETAVRAGALTRSVQRPDLLLVAALLHDIGKARGGEHCEVGAVIAGGLAERMGFDSEETDVLVTLVRHHLLLPDTATRRDLDDPDVIARVAQVVGSPDTLDLLLELTIADSLATGPTVSTEWRLSLIDDLARRVRASMAGRSLPEPPDLTEVQEVALSQSGVWVLMDVQRPAIVVTVAAPDRVGLLSLVAGVLSLNRLDVLAARVTTVQARAVQQWTVRPQFGEPPTSHQLGDDIRRAIEGTYDVAARLAQRDADYAQRPPWGYPGASVEVIPGESRGATILEVRAHDAPGLLFRITRAVAAADTSIIGAKVSTLGADAVDVFFVVDPNGNPLDADRRERLRASVESAVS